MDVNELINQFQSLARSHPYIGLAVILFIIGALVRGKTALVFYFLGGLALLKEFSLFGTFVEFLKDVPTLIDKLLSVFGGG